MGVHEILLAFKLKGARCIIQNLHTKYVRGPHDWHSDGLRRDTSLKYQKGMFWHVPFCSSQLQEPLNGRHPGPHYATPEVVWHGYQCCTISKAPFKA